jgi:pimeloyl-ACP methyl ester carboxylesterase
VKRLSLSISIALLAAIVPVAGAKSPAPTGRGCRDNKDVAKALTLDVEGEKATGHYALPSTPTDTLVVYAHGYGHDSTSWLEHMRVSAADHGVIAVAMDYRGTYVEKTEDGTTIRGWFVREGAADLVAAALYFQELCSIERTILFGVSMGGNASGLALAHAAERKSAAGGALFDHWFDVEGAVNAVETYAGASALAPANAFAANAKADIEAEMGGTPADNPEGYADLAVVSHMDEVAASGVKGVAVIHAVEDGLVPYNQAREIVGELAARQIPYEMYTIGQKGDGESGTTITGYSPVKDSPYAGHASETSNTHVVMVTAFDRLWSLVDEGVGFEGGTEHAIDLP